MLDFKPWYYYPGNKKRYYEEMELLRQRGFTQSAKDATGILCFTGDIQYKEFSISCIIQFKATHPYHPPFAAVQSINGQPFPEYFPEKWRHISPDGTICLFNNNRDKWSTAYMSSDVLERISVWLRCNVDDYWEGLEVMGPDPSFSNPNRGKRSVYISETLLRVPDGTNGFFSFCYSRDEKTASAFITEVRYKMPGSDDEVSLKGDTIAALILPVNTNDVRSGYFIAIDGPLPFRTEKKNLEWLLEHKLMLVVHQLQQQFWMKNAIKKRKPTLGFPPLAIAVRYKDERTRAYAKEACWLIFVMEGDDLSKGKGIYENYPPVYFSENSRMIRSTHEVLKDKSVAVVGCGTIGGEIALQLGKNGVKEILLYDYDFLSVGNTYRHVMDLTNVQKDKVDALWMQIYKFNPFCTVKTRKWRVDLSIHNIKCFVAEVQSFDLVVIAVGDRDSYYLISWILKKNKIPHVLVWSNWGAWGGEIVFIHPDSGCLHCYDNWRLDGEIPTLKDSPDQRDIYDEGCGFPTTPGNSYDLGLISQYATKKVVEYLRGWISGYHQIQLNSIDSDSPVFKSGALHPHKNCNCTQKERIEND